MRLLYPLIKALSINILPSYRLDSSSWDQLILWKADGYAGPHSLPSSIISWSTMSPHQKPRRCQSGVLGLHEECTQIFFFFSFISYSVSVILFSNLSGCLQLCIWNHPSKRIESQKLQLFVFSALQNTIFVHKLNRALYIRVLKY